MAEINDLGDIQNSFEHISEVLDSMRAQNAMNAGDMDKVLTNINLSLETLSKEEDSDFVNVFLSELKRSLDERHNFVSSRFEEIENSFKRLVENAGQQVKADELKPIFEAISTNLNGFAGEVVSQKALLSDLSLKLEELKQDDSTKKDVLKNISVLKNEIEKFNNGFESIIVSLNDNFKGVTQALLKIDSTDLLDSVKKDIENIFLSSNAVLSALQVIDRKNRDLEEVLNHVVTKEDFVLERDQVANLISQNIQLTDYISKLPTQDLMDGLTQRVDTAVGVINALKNVLNETSDQNQKMLVAQLENLEAKIINISTEDEFVGFRKELSNFAQEVIQSTNLMRADLMTTNSELKELLSYLTVLDIKDKFEHLSGLTQFTEENIKVNLKELSERVSRETEQSTSVVTHAVTGNFQSVAQKIDSAERNIVDNSKSNFSNILENVQSVLTNIFAMKNEIKVDSLESSENLDAKLKDLRDDLVSSKDAIVVNSQQNLASLLEGIEIVSGQLELAKNSISKGSEVNVERILSTVTKLSSDVLSVKQGLSQSAQANLENILSSFEQLSAELAFSKTAVVTSSQEGFDNVFSSIDKISQEISSVQGNLNQVSKENLSGILSSVAGLSQELSLTKEGLNESSREKFESILSIVQAFSQQMDRLKDNVNMNSQSTIDSVKAITEELSSSLNSFKGELLVAEKSNTVWIKSMIDSLSQELELVKDSLENRSNVNFESLTGRVQELSTKIEEAHEFTNTSFSEQVSEVKSSISTLPSIIQENQAIFEDEKRVLIEQNSRNIEELVEKIQNLTKGVINKDNPFKESIVFEIAAVRTLLTSVQEELSQKNAQAAEDINLNIQGLESLISKFSENSEGSLYNLQTKLTDYLQSIQAVTSSSDLKLEGSIKEMAEIKSEIQSVKEEVSALTSDPRLGELSFEVNKKLEGILLNITQFEEISSAKSQDNLQRTLTVMQEQFEKVMTNLEDHKNVSNQSSSEILENLTEKIGELQEQARISSTTVAQIINSKSNEIANGFTPVKEAIEKMAQVDFDKIVFDLKNQLEDSYDAFSTVIKSTVQEHKSEILEKIAQEASERFGALNDKLESLQAEANSKNSDTVESFKSTLSDLSVGVEHIVNMVSMNSSAKDKADRKDFLTGKFEDIENAILTSGEKNVATLETTIKMILEQLQGLNTNTVAVEEVVISARENLIGKLEALENVLVQSQNDSQFAAKEEVFEKLDQLESALIKSREASQSSSKEALIEKLDMLEASLILNQSDSQYNIVEKIQNKFEEQKTLDSARYEEMASLKSELLEGINSAKDESVSLIKDNADELISLKAELVGVINNVKAAMQEENSAFVKESLEEFGLLKAALLDEINNSNSQNVSILKDNLDGFSSAKDDILEEINSAKNESISLIRDNADELIALKEELVGVINNVKDAMQEENSALVKEGLEEFSLLKAALLEELNNSNSQNASILKDNLGDFGSAKADILEEINNAKNESISLIRDNADELISLKADLVDEISSVKNAILGENKFFTRGESEDFGSAKLDILEEITSAKSESLALINSNSNELISLKYDVLEEIKNAKNENNALIQSNSEELNSLKSELVEEINNSKLAIQEENSSLAKESLEELNSIKTELLDGINSAASSIQDVNSDKIDSIKADMDEIVSEINKAQEGFASHKLDIAQLLKINEEDAGSQFASIESTILEGISQNVEEFKTTVEAAAQQIEDKISLSEENYKTSTQSLLTDIKSSFYSNVEENLDELKSFMEVLESRTDCNAGLDNLKAEMFEKISILADDVEHIVSSISVKGDLEVLRTNVETSVSDLLEGLYDRILLAIEDNKVTQDVFEKSEEIARRVEDLKRTVEEDISEKLEGFGLSIDKQSKDFSNLISEIKVSLNELKENYVDLSLNSSMEISSLLSNVQGKIGNISDRLDGYDFNSIVEGAKSQLMDEIASVKDGFAKFDATEGFSEEFQGINQKLDLLALTSNDELEADINEIKESISAQGKFINELKSLDQLDKLSKLDEASVVQNEIKKIVSTFETKLEGLSSQEVDTKDHATEIKEELKVLKKDILECVLNVFDQISFVVEAEEIKDFVGTQTQEIMDFVEAKTGEIIESFGSGGDNGAAAGNLKEFIEEKATDIKENIKDSLGTNFNDILSSLDVLHDKAKGFDGEYYDIKNEIIDVKNHLQSLQSDSDDADYSYTFQDIESDIAKVRIILNEISQSKSGSVVNQVESSGKLSEDIMSISTRTNKLLLNSEESHNTLKVNLDEFRNVVYNLEDKVRRLDNTDVNKRIEKKIDAVSSLALSSVQSDKIFNQAFTYLAEWVDNASETMSSINEKVETFSELQDVKQSIAEIKKTVSKKTDLTAMLDKISDKFEQQQSQIERLEEKIERLASRKSQSSSKLDIEAIVAEVLAQVADNSGKADVKTAKKVDSIEKQLTKLSKNIEKLTSYVDAE